MKVDRSAWCTRCNREQPCVKSYDVRNGKIARYKTFHCLVCGDRVQFGRYRAKPTRDDTGKMRGSESEAAVGVSLAQMERAGLIRDLRRCNDNPRETYLLAVNGIKIARYSPDYSWTDPISGRRRVIDAKSTRKQPRDFKIVCKLMKALHGIDVEVRIPTRLERSAVKALNRGAV